MLDDDDDQIFIPYDSHTINENSHDIRMIKACPAS